MKSSAYYAKWLGFGAIGCLAVGLFVIFFTNFGSSFFSQPSRQTLPDNSTEQTETGAKNREDPAGSPFSFTTKETAPQTAAQKKQKSSPPPVIEDPVARAAFQEDSFVKNAQVLDQKETDPDENEIFTRVTLVKTDMKYPHLRISETIRKEPLTGEEILLTREIAVADHIMVKLAEGADEDQLAFINGKYGAAILKKMGAPGMYLVRLNKLDLDALPNAVEEYGKELEVISLAEPDYVVSALATIPNDEYFGNLWGMHQANDSDIDAPEAWDFVTGSTNVVVGVIDTGIDYNHEDLAANRWVNPGEIAGNGIDDDGNGYIDDVHGWDFYNDDNDPFDDHYHGTHVAGTIGGVGNNGIGVAGVCWTVKLMALKFLSAGGSGYNSDAVDAVYYATRMRVLLTSNSWGGGGYSQALKDAIDDAGSSNILFVAAAGNSANNNDSYAYYPATYSSSNLISVAATDSGDNLAYFSCYGATTVDLGAPGVSIKSSKPGNAYGSLSGTSMATPHVAGACALLKAYSSGLSALEIKQQLMDFTDPLAALHGKTLSGGRLNLLAALPGLWINNGVVSNITADAATLYGIVSNTGGEDPSVIIYWGESDGGTNSSAWDNSVVLGILGNGSFSADITGLTGSRTYYFRCYGSNSSDQVWASDTASFLAGVVDLGISKTVNDPAPIQGAVITYTIVITNLGPDTATGVEVKDVMPANVSYHSSSASQGAFDSGSGLWTIDALVSNSAVLTLNATVDSAGMFTNTALITADQQDLNTGNNSDSAVINAACLFTVAGSPAEHAGPVPLGYGDHAIYTATVVTNSVTSPADETNGTRYVLIGWTGTGSVPASGTTNTATFTVMEDSILTWNWLAEYWLDTTAGANGTVDTGDGWHTNGSQVTITASPDATYYFVKWTGDVPAGSKNSNPLTVSMDQPRSITANFGVATDVSVTKSVDNDTPKIGDTVTYTIDAKNLNANTATGVELTDLLPAGILFGSATASQGSYVATSGVWSVGTLSPGAAARLTIDATVYMSVNFASAIHDPSANWSDFGSSVCGIGENLFAVGSPKDEDGGSYAGRVYLYDASGTMQRIISSPAPASWDNFGYSISAVGANMLVIGAMGDDPGGLYNAGSVYLYDTGGTLLMSIANPESASYDYFGRSVAGVGSDKFVVGAQYDDPGGVYNAGSVYLYNTAGTLLASIPNPNPDSYDFFGSSVAGVGSDMFVVGAYRAAYRDGDYILYTVGCVYLYDTSGTLLVTIPNPEPSVYDRFGISIAGISNNMFVVGADYDDPGSVYNAGSAYLYDTSGTLLTTIPNPEPETYGYFGTSVDAVGVDRFIITAIGNGDDKGVAYLYDTSGTLLASITNPVPGSLLDFGGSACGVGGNKFVVGDPDTGELCLFEINADITNTASLTDMEQRDADAGNDSDSARIVIIRTGKMQFRSAAHSLREDDGTVTLTVTRAGGSSGPASVDYSTSDGTALAGSDYTSKSGTLSWSGGETGGKTIIISVTDDSLDESAETFAVTLSNAAGAGLGLAGSATVTIVDDETYPGYVQLDPSAYSVDEDAGTVTLTVTRTEGDTGSASVDFYTLDGTAWSGLDYLYKYSSVSWSHGDSAAKTITINISSDSLYEVAETFSVKLTNPSGVTLGSPVSATVTIVDAESNPGIVQFGASAYSVDEDAGTITLTVTRTGGSAEPAFAYYRTTDGMASAGSDYTAKSGTLSWSAGDASSKTMTIYITDDGLDEDNETFAVTITDTEGAGLGLPSSTTVTITDNGTGGDPEDPEDTDSFQFGSVWYSVNEDAGHVILTVTRTGDNSGPVSVDYATSDGTASAGTDYKSKSGTLSWSDGNTSGKTITIYIMDDSLDDNAETFTVTLSNPAGGELGSPASATVTIMDNDGQTVADIEAGYFKFVPVNLWAGDHPAMISFLLANEGPADIPAGTEIEMNFFLSSNMTFEDEDDIAIGTNTGKISLGVGSQMTIRYPGRAHNKDVTIPKGLSGYYYVFVCVRFAASSGLSDPDGAHAMRYGPINVRIHPADKDGKRTHKQSKTVNDYDGDAKSDLAVYQEETGYWYIILSTGTEINQQKFGGPGYSPLTGDYDGDWKTDLAVYHENSGYWYILPSTTYSLAYQKFGESGYIPVSGDFDGDGKTDLAVYQEFSGYWFILLSASGSLTYQKFGAFGYEPVSGDFDGDGKTDLAVYQGVTGYWFILLSSSGYLTYQKFGEIGYAPVSGDFDGDGKSDLAVYQEATGYWYILSSETGIISYQELGGVGYMPVPGDYDGDGRHTDLAVYHESSGSWYTLSSLGVRESSVQFGGPGFVPVGSVR